MIVIKAVQLKLLKMTEILITTLLKTLTKKIEALNGDSNNNIGFFISNAIKVIKVT